MTYLKRGTFACGFGPLILAIIYGFLYKFGVIEMLSVKEVVLGIVTSMILAFIAGGMNVIYEIDRLPLIFAMLIHGILLYLDYFIIYIINGWLKSELNAFLIFTICFIVGYTIIWFIIYLITMKSAKKLNVALEIQNKDIQNEPAHKAQL